MGEVRGKGGLGAWEAGVGGTEVASPVRAQRETGVGADVQPPWGNTACWGSAFSMRVRRTEQRG